MAKKPKKSTFSVGAVVRMWVELEIQAESFAEALSVAQTLTTEDFVSATGVVNDSNHRIINIYNHDDSLPSQ